MSLRGDNPDVVADLVNAGYTPTTDDELVDAYARRLGISPELARRALVGELDDVIVRD